MKTITVLIILGFAPVLLAAPKCFEKKSGKNIPIMLFQSLPTIVYTNSEHIRLEGDSSIDHYALQLGISTENNLVNLVRVTGFDASGFSVYGAGAKAPKGVSELSVEYSSRNELTGKPGIEYEFSCSTQ